MPKPDPALLNPERYPFSYTIEPRFSDLDVNMHVNNVALMEFAQEGRVRFHRANGFVRELDGGSSMIASFSIEFLAQAYYTDPLVNHVAVSHIGRSSHVVDLLITQQDRAIAWSQAVIVAVKDGKSLEITPAYRASAAEWMLRA